jgi:uncharacterized protein YfkK (UPF0435 family)
MNVKFPDDLLERSEKEIKEMVLNVGLIPFSKFLVSYLKEKDTFSKLNEKENFVLLEKVAIAVDSVLTYYQMVKEKNEVSPLESDLVNKFIEMYSANEKRRCEYR